MAAVVGADTAVVVVEVGAVGRVVVEAEGNTVAAWL